MKKYKEKYIGFLILFLITSCSLESKFSLPNDEKIIPELIGEWHSEESDNEMIKILKNGEKSYLIQIIDNNGTDELIAFSKTIKGITIMNVKTETKGIITNLFYGFSIESNTLFFFEINDKLRNGEFKSEFQLLKFFEENINKENFLINPTKLKRK